MSLKDLINAAMPGIVRGGLSVGGWAYLMSWRRSEPGRRIGIDVATDDTSETVWTLTLRDCDGIRYQGTGPVLEPLTLQAVNALGKHSGIGR